MKNLELLEKTSEKFTKKNKDNAYKFSASIEYASPGADDILDRYGIVLTKPSQYIVLTQDPKTLLQILDLAEKMKFIDAYREDPKRLTQLVTNVIKRMAKCEALHIPYRDEKGRVFSWLFSERGYKAYMASIGKEVSMTPSNESVSSEVVITPPEGFFNGGNGDLNNMGMTSSGEPVSSGAVITPPTAYFDGDNTELNKIKEYALRVLEQFNSVEKKDMIFAQLDQLQYSGLGIKEMILEAFKSCTTGDLGLVSATMDELLEQDKAKEQSKAKVLGGSAA
ncbi:MAG: hypothetical protein K2M17_05830 [Bacilli bacterium]|nr:hypothetical protein [Bacilli bacterium]